MWNYDPVESTLRELAEKAGEGQPRPEPKDWVMLAQWSPDREDLELGLVHWLIRRDDLATGRFDRVRASGDIVG